MLAEQVRSEPINDLQLSILIGVATMRNNGVYIGHERAELMRQRIKTKQDAIDFLAPERLLADIVDELPPNLQP